MVRGVHGHFENLNRNKRSVCIDLAGQAGKELFLGLVDAADVVIDNFRPGVMKRLGLDYAVLAGRNQKIIACSISGFGQTGHRSKEPAFDVIVQALSGAMSVTGESGNRPVRLGVPMGDLSGGLFAVIGILAALHERTETGRGQSVDVSMLDALTQLMLYYPLDFLNNGEVAGPVGGRHLHTAPYGVLKVSDGYIVVAVISSKFWQILCNALERPNLITDPRFQNAAARLKNQDELYEIIEGVTVGRTQAEWCEIFGSAGLPNAPVSTVDQVAQDPFLREREMFLEMDHSEAGSVFVGGRAIKFPQHGSLTVTRAPIPGEHKDEVLQELLGMTPEQIAALKKANVIL
jgi:CoA:oxalate CoA-transferase